MTESPAEAGVVRGEGSVELTLPADSAYVSVLRTVAASLAARRDFTIEEIDDLRIAVDEASALLLPQGLPTSRLSASFTGDQETLSVTVAITPAAQDVADIDETSFAWMVLSALADDVRASSSPSGKAVTLTKARGARV